MKDKIMKDKVIYKHCDDCNDQATVAPYQLYWWIFPTKKVNICMLCFLKRNTGKK